MFLSVISVTRAQELTSNSVMDDCVAHKAEIPTLDSSQQLRNNKLWSLRSPTYKSFQ